MQKGNKMLKIKILIVLMFAALNIQAKKSIYEIEVTDHLGEIRRFTPTTKTNYKIPMDLAGYTCVFNEFENTLSSTSYAALICTYGDKPQAGIEITAAKNSPGVFNIHGTDPKLDKKYIVHKYNIILRELP